MPTLRVAVAGQSPKIYPLYKKITSIGRSVENDIALDDPLLADSHAHIHFDGRDFNITAIDRSGDLAINGKKRKVGFYSAIGIKGKKRTTRVTFVDATGHKFTAQTEFPK